MSEGINYLANLFKERENPHKIGAVIGRIKEVDEILDAVKIHILDGQVLITQFYSLIHKFEKEDIGKEVLMMPTEDNQCFFVLGYFKKFETKEE